MMKNRLIEKFEELYGAGGDIRVYFAPGRVNLIGEHTDYNGGHVFPCALQLGMYGIIRKREDDKLRFYSANFEKLGITESSLADLKPYKKAGWTNYPKGVMWAFEKKGHIITCGLDILVYGTVPNASGLSSSAAMEVMVGTALNDLFEFGLTKTEIALIGQYSENNFNGCNCGIMDQFSSAMGKKDHAIFLDTSTLKYEYAPIHLGDAKIIVVNSKVKHSIVDSAYNDRRRECEEALKELQTVVDIQTLGDLTEELFEMHQHVLSSEVRRKRAKHAVYENRRTIKAVAALKENDIETFGKLMNESHISLRDDYEVSCEEIDFLVELTWETEGVLGSRITGGGFGGCTVNIVKKDCVEAFIERIKTEYKGRTGLDAQCYVIDIGMGARRIE